MDYASRRGRAVIVSFLLVPASLFANLLASAALDYILGSLEVARFIREHRPIVAQRLSDPKVHSFSLGHAPGHAATLLIRFDVEDKATYLMLEDDLSDHWDLRFPARWNTHLRSNEDLGNNFGFAAQGISEVVGFLIRILVAAVVSSILAGAYLLLALRRLRAHRGKGEEVIPKF